MNKIVNKLLLAGDNFISELHLRQPRFTYSSCGPFTKDCTRIKKFIKTFHLNRIYKNELTKACFVHDASYSDIDDLAKRSIYDKILKDRAYGIAVNPKYDIYQRGLATMVYNFFLCKGRTSSRITQTSD